MAQERVEKEIVVGRGPCYRRTEADVGQESERCTLLHRRAADAARFETLNDFQEDIGALVGTRESPRRGHKESDAEGDGHGERLV